MLRKTIGCAHMTNISPDSAAFDAKLRRHPWYDETYRSSSFLVGVAIELAKEKHEGQYRKKRDGKLPYITHPIMVCKLLEMFGSREEIDYAAAILHDVMEDCEPYKSMREAGNIKEAYSLLREDIEGRMVAHLGGRVSGELLQSIRSRVSKVADVVAELTNPHHMGGPKRMVQVMDVQRMSDRAKLIKILDQTASIMDDIFFERDVGKDTNKIANYAYKALNVVNAASRSNTPTLRLARHYFKGCFICLMQTIGNAPEHAERMRKGFIPEEYMAHARTAATNEEVERIWQAKAYDGHEELLHPDVSSLQRGNPAPKHGCVSVSLAHSEKEGLVVSGYKCLVNDELPDDTVITRSYMLLMANIEAFSYDRHVDIGDSVSVGQEPAIKLARSFTIHPPMPLGDFLAAAHEANRALTELRRSKGKEDLIPGIIDMRFSTALRAKSRAVAQGNELS